MIGEISTTPHPATAHTQVQIWPPDDTEESVTGTGLHQLTIINIRLGINEIAGSQTEPGRPVPWQALSQTMVTGFERPDRSRFKMLPDVFVYAHPIDRLRGSVALGVDGAPVLVVEVLSEATYDSDLDIEAGKGWSYAHAGVREYLALDPTGAYVPDRIRAWRLVDGRYLPWLTDAAGRWQSAEIAVAFGLEDDLPAVYRPDGRRTLREGEIEAELADLRRQIEELRADRSV